MLLQSDVLLWNEQVERLPRPELAALQWQRLRDLLARVQARVPFYRDRLKAAQLDPAKVESLSQLQALPFTSKSDLRDHYPLALLAVDHSELRRIHASSGTRGKPTIAAYTGKDLELWADLVARCLTSCGTRPAEVVQNAYGYGLFTGGLGIHYGAEHLGAAVIPASSGRTQQQIMLLKDLQARTLCCTPSYALNIAATMEEMRVQRSDLKLEIGIFGAEPWSEECRAQLEKALGIKAYDIYGLSEVMGPGVAVECAAQQGLHIWEDHFLVEIIDPETLEPVSEGQPGELVLTTLTKEALPLIRYRTGDRCALIEEPCPCGRTARRITRLQGRLDDMLIIRGVNVYPSEIESVLYGFVELSPQYQIIIERVQTLDSLRVRVELTQEIQAVWQRANSEPIERRNLEIGLTDALRQRFGLSAVIELLDPVSLPRSEGKALHVLDMREGGGRG